MPHPHFAQDLLATSIANTSTCLAQRKQSWVDADISCGQGQQVPNGVQGICLDPQLMLLRQHWEETVLPARPAEQKQPHLTSIMQWPELLKFLWQV